HRGAVTSRVDVLQPKGATLHAPVRLVAALTLLGALLSVMPAAVAAGTISASAVVAGSMPDAAVQALSALSSGNRADKAFNEFLSVYWDASADSFYARSDHRNRGGDAISGFWWSAQLWDLTIDDFERTNRSSSRHLIDDIYDGFVARHPSFDS